jgi:hypothetical protein
MFPYTFGSHLGLAFSWRIPPSMYHERNRFAYLITIFYGREVVQIKYFHIPYPNDQPENLAYILRDSGSQLLLLEDQACGDRLTPAAEQLARLKRIVTQQPVEQTGATLGTIVCLAD